jgi:hypothetical protein
VKSVRVAVAAVVDSAVAEAAVGVAEAAVATVVVAVAEVAAAAVAVVVANTHVNSEFSQSGTRKHAALFMFRDIE